MARQNLKTKPDPVLVKDQLQTLQTMYTNYGAEVFTANMVWILIKKPDPRTGSRTVPYRLNRVQRLFESRCGNRNIVLKARQMGLTTHIAMRRLFIPTLINPGTNGLLISQSAEFATAHFGMLRRAYKWVAAVDPRDAAKNAITRSLHENLLHTSASNRKEIIFDQLDNRITIASAENEEAGQGITLHRIHASEVARWPGKPEETLANLKEALVLDGTLDEESTANGLGGYFYDEWQRAESGDGEFVAHFFPWWEDDQYRIALTDKQEQELQDDLTSDEKKVIERFNLDLEQISFRRNKQKSLRHNFDEKYPENTIDAFLTSGNIYFDKDILRLRTLELMSFQPHKSFSGGNLVYMRKVIPGRRYVLGADVASGKQIGDETDFSAIKVVDEQSGAEVAAYMYREAPEDFAQTIYDLGKYFNFALAAVERSTAQDSGGEGGTVLLTLATLGYPNIYQHREYFKDRKDDGKKKITTTPGFPMNKITRPIALNKLRFKLMTFPELITDKMLIKQMGKFVRNEKGRPEASEGQHDDMVMASAIAEAVRAVQLGDWDPLDKRREKYADNPAEFKQPEEIET